MTDGYEMKEISAAAHDILLKTIEGLGASNRKLQTELNARVKHLEGAVTALQTEMREIKELLLNGNDDNSR